MCIWLTENDILLNFTIVEEHAMSHFLTEKRQFWFPNESEMSFNILVMLKGMQIYCWHIFWKKAMLNIAPGISFQVLLLYENLENCHFLSINCNEQKRKQYIIPCANKNVKLPFFTTNGASSKFCVHYISRMLKVILHFQWNVLGISFQVLL